MPSWFESEYIYGVEEGEKESTPSKLGVVRKDGNDFDDANILNLRQRLEASIFPKSIYRLSFETDEFRRFVCIYIDSARNEVARRTGEG